MFIAWYSIILTYFLPFVYDNIYDIFTNFKKIKVYFETLCRILLYSVVYFGLQMMFYQNGRFTVRRFLFIRIEMRQKLPICILHLYVDNHLQGCNSFYLLLTKNKLVLVLCQDSGVSVDIYLQTKVLANF